MRIVVYASSIEKTHETAAKLREVTGLDWKTACSKDQVVILAKSDANALIVAAMDYCSSGYVLPHDTLLLIEGVSLIDSNPQNVFQTLARNRRLPVDGPIFEEVVAG